MTPDFDKIQAGMVNGLNKTKKTGIEEKAQTESNNPSFKNIGREDMEAGVVGRSSVRMDNHETDMRKFKENPVLCGVAMELADLLMDQGYSQEEAITTAMAEFNLV